MTTRQTAVAGLAALALWMAFSAPASSAQGTQGPLTPKPGAAAQQNPEGTIRVKIAVVNAPVVVTDAKGELILDLQQKDFHVFDNGVEQTVDTFDLGGEPL